MAKVPEQARQVGRLRSVFRAALGETPFARLALAKFLQLLAQNALIYGLFILVVRQQQSSLATSAFVITSILPSIVLSLPGGIAADLAPVKLSLIWTLVARMAIAWFFFESEPGLFTVLLLTTLNWSVYQFYSPAESAALPAVRPPEGLANATAVLQALSLLAQLAGAGIVAPLTLKLFDERVLFALVFLLLLAAALVIVSIPRLTPRRRQAPRRASLAAHLPAGIRAIQRSDVLTRATVMRVVVETSTAMVVVAAPILLADVLRTKPENAVYIAAPGAIGLAAGLILAPLLLTVVPVRSVLWAGFLLTLLTITGLAEVGRVADVLDEQAQLPLRQLQETFGVRREIATTMLLLPLGGLGLSLVQVTSRAAVYRHAAGGVVAQVFATQSAIGSFASLLPIALSGLLLDLLPVGIVLWLIVAAMLVATTLLATATRRLGASG